MSEPERKRTSKLPDTFREVDGFGKPEAKPGTSSQRDPGTVRPVDLTPDAKAMKLGARERKRHESITPPLTVPERPYPRTLKHRPGSSGAWRSQAVPPNCASRSIHRLPAEAGAKTRLKGGSTDRPSSP